MTQENETIAGDRAVAGRATQYAQGPRKRRRVVMLSKVDQRLREHGLPVSWDECAGAAHVAARLSRVSEMNVGVPLGGTGKIGEPQGGNEQRLREEVPPHWHMPL
ncbi:hypothetical protein [Schaalia sp. lx-260]|uniref:hypothetical protein n=1 Tax=Schaalia sp. lx-260 TaxID=2899082 RepID=UPI001E3BA934|nr:hypothetical protein [Schaalia sp. lx-260]MCD4549008.1 hypothetical protein [Schaalia sp. lx-260]